MVVGIDPGYEQSAFIRCDLGQPVAFGIVDNQILVEKVKANEFKDDTVVLEYIVSYGMAVGQEIFDTCRYIGRLEEMLPDRCSAVIMMNRREVKQTICNDSRANDSNIRQAIINLYGPTKENAIGKKSNPGPLHGIKYDVWQALALVISYERQKNEHSTESSHTV